jgi:hypothetical protein
MFPVQIKDVINKNNKYCFFAVPVERLNDFINTKNEEIQVKDRIDNVFTTQLKKTRCFGGSISLGFYKYAYEFEVDEKTPDYSPAHQMLDALKSGLQLNNKCLEYEKEFLGAKETNFAWYGIKIFSCKNKMQLYRSIVEGIIRSLENSLMDKPLAQKPAAQMGVTEKPVSLITS